MQTGSLRPMTACGLRLPPLTARRRQPILHKLHPRGMSNIFSFTNADDCLSAQPTQWGVRALVELG